METRKEHDLIGTRLIPMSAYYGIQTDRALDNFNISGIKLKDYPLFIKSLAMVKYAAAKANCEAGLLDAKLADVIAQACHEVMDGLFDHHFPVDMIQGGAGTSTNMNINEVVANRSLEILGKKRGEYKYCHPNNHVNLSQSTNDAYPTALKLTLIYTNKEMRIYVKSLVDAFYAKAEEFKDVVKMGRTQLQDAVPMTVGQEFTAFANTLEEEIDRLEDMANLFLEINMGATAIGTGINSVPGYPEKCLSHLKRISGLNLKLAANLIEATSDTGAFVMYSSAVKRLAIKLSKICNDLRLLSSGPRCGFNEINLPALQPGSSIMPGKVNPVIPEVVNQIAYKVIGNDLTVSFAAEAGQLQLNVMEPIIVQSLLESIQILNRGMETLRTKCVKGITINAEHCENMVKNSIGIVTVLSPVLGYEISSDLAKKALRTGASVYDLVLEGKHMPKAKLDKLLDPKNMLSPHDLEK